MNIALITASGIGSRMNQEIPKQFTSVNDKPIIIYTLECFQKNSNIDEIIVACLNGWESVLNAYAKQYGISKLKYVVKGGATGQESIFNCIKKIEEVYPDENPLILVHDGVRAFCANEVIDNCITIAQKYGNSVTVEPCNEAMLLIDTIDQNWSNSSYPRDLIKKTQTPHGFYLNDIVELHRKAKEKGIVSSVATCTLAIELGEKVFFSKGSPKNFKITTSDDLDMFKALINMNKQ